MPKKKCGKRTTADRPSLSLISLPRCRVTQIGATFDDGISLEEWADIGKKAIRVSEAIQWIVGDWLNFGYKKFIEALEENSPDRREIGERYRIALECLPYEYGTLRNIAWISAQVPVSRRRDKLPFTHHQEVANLSPANQIKFLRLAEEKGWSRSKLRVEIRHENGEVETDSEGQIPVQPFTIWTTRARMILSREDVTCWPAERREATKRELQFFVDFYNRL